MFKWKRKVITSENISIEENTKVFIKDFLILVKNGKKETVQNLIKFMANSIQAELLSKCLYNDRNYKNYMRNITYSILLDLPFENYQKCNIKVNIAQTPIISCVWNHRRVIDNLCHIGICHGNPFDGDANAYNIEACLVEPLGLIIVEGGNHSVNSGIIHNEGEIIVNTKVDISSVLEKYEFNGKNYVDRHTKEKINNIFLKNYSEPFTYTLGLFFEMARVLKNQ